MITIKQYLDSILENKLMPNIKITAEVDGKQVPLETISTEMFEAIKALEKPKEIPVASIGNYPGKLNDKRLLLRITDNIKNKINQCNAYVIAIDLQDGCVSAWGEDENFSKFYDNIQPL